MIGQDLEPAQQTYNVLGQPNVFLSPETINYFKQTKFIRSWHCENDYLINQVVNSNGFDYNSMMDQDRNHIDYTTNPPTYSVIPATLIYDKDFNNNHFEFGWNWDSRGINLDEA
ncbi:MAG: hypothetical protein A2X64_07405 [Ignavibacteria bacterium GWF2_33_9]|nr:MAG: hypothetical protein A2X64_07405 [Ignavibacteria bacterium GWF2_33_9]